MAPEPAGGEALLQLEDVHAGYGEIEVLRGVTVTVGAREIVSIIGANGAGKSTLLRTVFGMVKPDRRAASGSAEKTSAGAIPWTCSGAAARTCRRGGATSRP